MGQEVDWGNWKLDLGFNWSKFHSDVQPIYKFKSHINLHGLGVGVVSIIVKTLNVFTVSQVCVQAVFIDDEDTLWVVDGLPFWAKIFRETFLVSVSRNISAQSDK